MRGINMNLLTHSRMSAAKTCLRKHFLAYEYGLKRRFPSDKLRIGSAVHLGLEILAKGGTLDEAFSAIRSNYAEVPRWVNTPELADEWDTECVICCALVSGYQWRWQSEEYEVVQAEQEFCLPLRNPATGRSSRIWNLAGKIDRIVRLHDGRLAVLETKTTGDPIEPDSDYWKRLRMDQQISLYMLAARELGYPVETVIYDVIRKPQIGRLQIPLLDADGCKIVLDSSGNRVYNQNGKPRQSADSANGWTLQSRLQTPTEFLDRLIEDITSRTDFYYARQEIPRLQMDLEQFQHELWHQQCLLNLCRNSGYWFRNTNACLHPWKCEYFDVCSAGWESGDPVPDGFMQTTDIHAELEFTKNGGIE